MSSKETGPSLGIVVLVSAVTAASVSVVVVWATQSGLITLGGDVEVPLLTGLSEDSARGMLEARDLRMVGRGERHDEEADEGIIVEQQPSASSRVPRGSEISVVVSLGPDLVAVPDLIGLSPDPARARLANAGLTADPVVREGGTGTPGTITSTSPPAGQQVARGTVVALTAVPVQTTVAVPDLTGMGARAAREAIVAAGFVVGPPRTGFDGDRAPYIVLRQTPVPGTQAEPGSEIQIVINEE